MIKQAAFFPLLKLEEEEPKINRIAVARYGHHIKIITKPVKHLLAAAIYVVFMAFFYANGDLNFEEMKKMGRQGG